MKALNIKDKKKLIILASAAAALIVAVIIIFVTASRKPVEKPVPTPAPTATPAPSPTPAPTPTPEAVQIPIDFAELWAQNPHVYAWITIPDTNINYPILQHPDDNSYYLDHNMDGSAGYPGCIYTENYNAKDFTDPNTVIYGHNMRNGTMFRNLHKFENLDFFNSHRTVYIYTPTQILEYRIFAAYVSDNSHQLLCYDFTNPNIYTEYLRNIMSKKGNIDTGINLNSANNIITLMTCTGNESYRYIVQAALSNVKGEPDIIVPSSLVVTGDAVSQ